MSDDRTLGRDAVALVLALVLLLAGGTVRAAEDEGAIAEVTGGLEAGAAAFYMLPGLKRGQSVAIYASGSSGNLDPFVGITKRRVAFQVLQEQFLAELDRQALTEERDVVAATAELADALFQVWDDDGGEGYAASFEWTVPADGDYQLVVLGAPPHRTFGDYRLLVGLDAPEVLSGEADPRGEIEIVVDLDAFRPDRRIQEVTGTLIDEKPEAFVNLKEIGGQETLFVYIEAISGDLAPTVLLKDFGDKTLLSANLGGEERAVAFEYAFAEASRDVRLEIVACCEDGQRTTGDYRLLVGLNAPDVLDGKATPTGRSLLEEPIEVRVGLAIDQITGVNQKEENFGIVGDLRMEWRDPRLAFSPDSCQCSIRLLPIDGFLKYTQDAGATYPNFVISNQQGRRWSQSDSVLVKPDGQVKYYERLSATLQAPDFEFQRFPFDRQEFFVRIRSVLPNDFYIYRILDEVSVMGDQLGEEEWVTEGDRAYVDQVGSNSRFNFTFFAHRHLNYYVMRIFMPVAIIVFVSWVVFFLRDYGKRIDLSGGNFLVFIAFNFTIASDLPRLGYLTFMDAVLVSTFMITGLVLIFNVYLRRLEAKGNAALAQRIDRFTLWGFPVGYLIALVVVTWRFMS